VRIGIYHELASEDIGGAECCVAMLAEALARRHRVEVVNHAPALTLDRLAAFTGTDLAGVRLRHVPADFRYFEDAPLRPFLNPRRQYCLARAWQQDLTAPYDLFVTFIHHVPPFCHARRGVLVVLFPTFCPQRHWPWKGSRSPLRRCVRGLYQGYYAWEWKKRLGTYQVRAAISDYTRKWTRLWWGVDCPVVYPPVDTRFRPGEKEDLLLSVGRFTDWMGLKRQQEMITAFRKISDRLPGWRYYCVGGLSELAADRAYFERARRLAEGGPVHIEAGLKRARVKELLTRARVFWHAAGYGHDGDLRPEVAEHFGIATVEAMAAGCVPVVINKGAQPEIVRHGVDGFLWDTPEQLQTYTLKLARDGGLFARMSEAARNRARRFTRDRFVRELAMLLQPAPGGLGEWGEYPAAWEGEKNSRPVPFSM
jgi:glycosyltransferase involved in cell wall biosynthesis